LEGWSEQSCESHAYQICAKGPSMSMLLCEKKHFGISLADTQFHMCNSDQFYLNPTWVVPLKSIGLDVRRATLIWKIMMNPYDIQMEDTSNHFFK
jgi:hypothetical protein